MVGGKKSISDVNEFRLVKPYLLAGGISFLISTIFALHIIMQDIVKPIPFLLFEGIIQSITFFIGVVFIILVMVQIRSLYTFNRKSTDLAIIMLSIFVVIQIFYTIFPTILIMLSWIAFIVPFFAFSLIRLIASILTNNALKIPKPEYSTNALLVYGWTFPITSLIEFILVLIGVFSNRPELIDFVSMLLIIQNFIDAYCILAFSLTLICHAICNPKIQYKIHRKTILADFTYSQKQKAN